MRSTSLIWRRVHSLYHACSIKGLRINLKMRNSICCSTDKSFPIGKMFTCLFSVGHWDNLDFLMMSWLFHSIFSKWVLCIASKVYQNVSMCKLQHLDLKRTKQSTLKHTFSSLVYERKGKENRPKSTAKPV